MAEIIKGLHVGSLEEANSLFTSQKDSENSDSVSASHETPDSIDTVTLGVFTVCQDLPDWCSLNFRSSNKRFNIKNEALSKLYHSHASDSYINLHFDFVYLTEESEDLGQPESEPVAVVHSVIRANDDPEEKFYKAFQFSYELFEHILSTDKGFVFVHCLMGMCRSTSLICSYLMKKWNKRFLEVKDYMKNVYPKTAISHYFEYQMILYYKNGFKIGDENVFYNYYSTTLDHHLENRHNMTLETPEEPQFIYSCKICRETLFSDTNTINHRPKSSPRESQSECNSIFIEPMTWMKDLESPNGKLFCSNLKCNSKLGYFSWHGRKCSCGHLQVPAFQVQISKVDRFKYHNGNSVPSKDVNLEVK